MKGADKLGEDRQVGTDTDAVIVEADRAMYAAKRHKTPETTTT